MEDFGMDCVCVVQIMSTSINVTIWYQILKDCKNFPVHLLRNQYYVWYLREDSHKIFIMLNAHLSKTAEKKASGRDIIEQNNLSYIPAS